MVTPIVLVGTISCSNNNSQANNDQNTEQPPTDSGNTPPPSITSPDQGGSSGTEQPNPDTPETPSQPVIIPENTNILKSENINAFSVLEARIINNNLDRKENTAVYETDLTREYGDEFKYPAWNFNYEINNGQNRYQTIKDKQVDGPIEVFAERTDFQGERVKFSDPRFILDEIANNRLKQHPAAKGWYQNNVLPTTKAVEKTFSISGGISGPTALGLYIPAGEVATLKFDNATVEKMLSQNIKDFRIILNSSYWDNKKAVDDSGQISNRYPFVKTEFTIDLKKLKADNGEFRFGSPFGGTISIRVNTKLKSSNFNPNYLAFDNFQFSVKGAVEMLSYFHTVTTKAQWNDQVARVLSGEISAPGLALDFAFGSTNIAATGPNEFAYKKLNQIVYPFEILEKWTAFLFVSEFFASRDRGNNAVKIDFKFCDDIWGGAGAWGGGNGLSAPLRWAAGSFLSGNDKWLIASNWGTFHEINHNFQQDSALFKKRGHPETNQVSMVNLSLLSDSGRWRNPYNISAEFTFRNWSEFQNIFSTIQRQIIDRNFQPISEYPLQSIILNTVGTFNFIDYVRNDVLNHPNTKVDWNGFEEIVQLSDTFKLNFWPALANFAPLWNDGWPASYDEATSEQQAQIDRLNSSYKAFDFVGNIFAVGPYLYNQTTKAFDYTNDMQAPIDIAAGAPYLFDFEKGINSANRDFSWSQLKFDEKSKLGGSLKQDQTNKKHLIYEPPKGKAFVGQVDEFNVSIVPDHAGDSKATYVPEYMWKIKVRLVANLPVVSVYKETMPTPNNKNFYQDFPYLKNDDNISFATVSDPRLGILQDQSPDKLKQWQRAKISFNFVAPVTGTYNFQLLSNSWIFVVNRNQPNDIWWKATTVPKDNWATIGSLTLNAGQIVPLDVYLTTFFDKTKLEIKAVVNDQAYDVFEHALVPWANTLSEQPQEFLDPKYAYKSRMLDFNNFQTSLLGLNVARPKSILSKFDANGNANYIFKSDLPAYKDIEEKLSQVDGKWFEKWGPANVLPYEMTFDVEFKEKQAIGSVIFYHRTNNWAQARPTKVQIFDQDQKELFNGSYGAQFKDRGAAYSRLSFDQIYEASKLTFKLSNDVVLDAKKQSSAIILDAIEFSDQQILNLNRVVPIQDPAISVYGSNWQLIPNDPQTNISAVNGVALATTKAQEYIEFKLFADGFDLIGQKGPEAGEFDLYINDILVKTVNAFNSIRLDNQILASYNVSGQESQWLKIKIVNKNDKRLVLNYFQTYGFNVYTQNAKSSEK